MISNLNALVCNRVTLIQSLHPLVLRTFAEYSWREFQQRIMEEIQLISTKRLDRIWDTYSQQSINNGIYDARGAGIRRHVLPGSPVPRNWDCFLRINSNKEDIVSLFGRRLIDDVSITQVLTNIGDNYFCSATTSTSVSCWTAFRSFRKSRLYCIPETQSYMEQKQFS